MPPSHILFFSKKKPKPKKEDSLYRYVMGAFFFVFIFYFFLNKICDKGILEKKKKKPKWSNCNSLKVWGGGGKPIKCHV
jgi:hypothetical protein